MSNYPQQVDVFLDKQPGDIVSSSDPNNSFSGIENIEGFVGALGKPQTWSVTLLATLRNYRTGLKVQNTNYLGGGPIVTAGEAVLENTDRTLYVFRQNISDVTLTASHLDSGSLAATATYYIYAYTASAGTTAPLCFSTDANKPSSSVVGTGPYLKLGEFKNVAAGSLTCTHAFPYDPWTKTIERGFYARKIVTAQDLTATTATTNGAFNTWDISSIVPENTKAVLMWISGAAAATNKTISFRTTNGSAELEAFYAPGASQTETQEFIINITDSRTLDYKISQTAWDSANITIIGWWC